MWVPKIENGPPIPERINGHGPKSKIQIPWTKIGIGQSIFVPEYVRDRRAVCAAAFSKADQHGVHFVVRRWVEKGVLGSRIWRDW